ncbi:hypothetical protein [Streptococcus pneumoniae]|uniref:hypothetical protein n=1 Tax=Streptococcus pneumoniae TaxID=1313 RepID=UPI0012626881|nr:hypothetical protein [Streptococcus pneumoniae]
MAWLPAPPPKILFLSSFSSYCLNNTQKIKEQTRKLATGCSKHRFEPADRTDEVRSKHRFEVADRTDEVSSKHCFEIVDRTAEVSNHTYGKVKLTWFEESFEEYK